MKRDTGPQKIVMAALQIGDDDFRPICVGCTEILEAQSMLKRVRDRPINERQPQFRVVVFKIVPPFTLAECQAAVSCRHYDPRWGE